MTCSTPDSLSDGRRELREERREETKCVVDRGGDRRRECDEAVVGQPAGADVARLASDDDGAGKGGDATEGTRQTQDAYWIEAMRVHGDAGGLRFVVSLGLDDVKGSGRSAAR